MRTRADAMSELINVEQQICALLFDLTHQRTWSKATGFTVHLTGAEQAQLDGLRERRKALMSEPVAEPVPDDSPEPEAFLRRVAEMIGMVNRGEGTGGVEYPSAMVLLEELSRHLRAYQREIDRVAASAAPDSPELAQTQTALDAERQTRKTLQLDNERLCRQLTEANSKIDRLEGALANAGSSVMQSKHVELHKLAERWVDYAQHLYAITGLMRGVADGWSWRGPESSKGLSLTIAEIWALTRIDEPQQLPETEIPF